MGIIYRIFNIESNKSYIGKTSFTIYDRLEQHIKDYRIKDFPRYRAFRKYGLDKFSLEILGEFAEEELSKKEILFIKEFNSYGNNGYNATLGGEGRRTIKYSDKEIINHYITSKSLTVTANFFKIDRSSVRNTLKRNDIKQYNVGLKGRIVPSIRKRVLCKTLNLEFQSLSDCSEYLIEAGIVSGKIESINSSLSKACRGARKTYKKLEFTYLL